MELEIKGCSYNERQINIEDMRLQGGDAFYLFQQQPVDPLAGCKNLISCLHQLIYRHYLYPSSQIENRKAVMPEPISEDDYEPSAYIDEEELIFPDSLKKSKQDVAKAINTINTIQELSLTYEKLKNIQESVIMETSLDSIIYSLDYRCELEEREPRFDENDYEEESALLQSAYHDHILEPINSLGINRLSTLLDALTDYHYELFVLFQNLRNKVACELYRTEEIFKSRCRDRRLILTLLNERYTQVLNKYAGRFLSLTKNDIKCGKYTYESRVAVAYKRLNESILYKEMICGNYQDTNQGYADFICDFFDTHSHFAPTCKYDDVWEFLCCIMEVALLENLYSENGYLPDPFFPMPEGEVEKVGDETPKLPELCVKISEEEHKMLIKAAEAGLLKYNSERKGYDKGSENISKRLVAYLCGRLFCGAGPSSENEEEAIWDQGRDFAKGEAAMCKSLFGINISETRRGGRSKNCKPPQGYKSVDKLFR